jgi:4-oxalocrotonate tautomerase
MPIVSIKALAGVFTAEQKAAIIKGVTDAIVSVEGERMRPLTWVLMEDVPEGDWGIGGNGLLAEHVKAVQEGAVKLGDALGIK